MLFSSNQALTRVRVMSQHLKNQVTRVDYRICLSNIILSLPSQIKPDKMLVNMPLNYTICVRCDFLQTCVNSSLANHYTKGLVPTFVTVFPQSISLGKVDTCSTSTPLTLCCLCMT